MPLILVITDKWCIGLEYELLKLLLKLKNKLNSILNFENRSISSRDMKFLWNISKNFKKWRKIRNSSKCHILGCLWFVFGDFLGEVGLAFRLAFGISWNFGIWFGSFWIRSKNKALSSFSKIPHSSVLWEYAYDMGAVLNPSWNI